MTRFILYTFDYQNQFSYKRYFFFWFFNYKTHQIFLFVHNPHPNHKKEDHHHLVNCVSLFFSLVFSSLFNSFYLFFQCFHILLCALCPVPSCPLALCLIHPSSNLSTSLFILWFIWFFSIASRFSEKHFVAL